MFCFTCIKSNSLWILFSINPCEFSIKCSFQEFFMLSLFVFVSFALINKNKLILQSFSYFSCRCGTNTVLSQNELSSINFLYFVSFAVSIFYYILFHRISKLPSFSTILFLWFWNPLNMVRLVCASLDHLRTRSSIFFCCKFCVAIKFVCNNPCAPTLNLLSLFFQ